MIQLLNSEITTNTVKDAKLNNGKNRRNKKNSTNAKSCKDNSSSLERFGIHASPNSVLDGDVTDSSLLSDGEIISPSNLKLRNKFDEIQLSHSDRSEIYKFLWTLDHIENGEYKIKWEYKGKEIDLCLIAKSNNPCFRGWIKN